jgi:hypothetical protein
MAEVQITWWREIPSMVTVREGERVIKSELPTRFGAAIDEAAMRLGAVDADAYLDGWRRGDWEQRAGSPEAIAEGVCGELERDFDHARVEALLASYAG